MSTHTAQETRTSLPRPAIDADGHIIEYMPEIDRLLRKEGISGGMGDNTLRMYTDSNPHFFDGTVLEAYARDITKAALDGTA